MPDRKDVIKGIEQCLIGACKPCPYYSNDASCGCEDKLMEDALALLKAEKPNCAAANRDAGGCLGYCYPKSDDEPIDICKGCNEYTGNRERW